MTTQSGTDLCGFGVLPTARAILIDHKPASYALAGARLTLTEAEFMAQFAQQEG